MNKLFCLLLFTLLAGCGSDNNGTGSTGKAVVNIFSITNVNLTDRTLDFIIIRGLGVNSITNVSPLNTLNKNNLNFGSGSVFAYSVVDSNTKERISNEIGSFISGPERSRLFIAVPDTRKKSKNKANYWVV